MLFYFDDLKTDDIAKILGIAHPTVRTRLARARKHLRSKRLVVHGMHEVNLTTKLITNSTRTGKKGRGDFDFDLGARFTLYEESETR